MAQFGKDLTSGSVTKRLIAFALPFVLSSVIQSLYNIADMVIVGQFIGKTGISGVNIGGQVTFIMTNVAISLCTGGTIVIGQFIGARDRESATSTISTLITFLLWMAAALTLLMFLLDDFVLQLIKTPEESYQYAKDYLSITIMGAVFIFGYNALSGIMRGMGDSKTPLFLVAGACLINIALDYLFVGRLNMEVRGAAYATVISQAFSMITCVFFLIRNDFMFDFRLSSFKIKWNKLRLIISTGIPILIQNVAMNFSFLVMTTLANGLGVTSSAALGIVSRFNGFALLPSIAIGSSVSAMVAQNIGAGHLDRSKKTMYIGIIISAVVTLPIFLMTVPVAPYFISLFNTDSELIRVGVEYLRFFSLEYMMVPILSCVFGLISGAGHTRISSIGQILSSLFVRVPLAFFLVNVLDYGLAGIGLSGPFATAFGMALAIIYYLTGRWQKPVIVKKSVPAEL